MATDFDGAVLAPDQFGALAVCDLNQLVANLLEGQSLDEAIGNAAFDTIEHPVEREAIEKVRRLNETGDSAGYWLK